MSVLNELAEALTEMESQTGRLKAVNRIIVHPKHKHDLVLACKRVSFDMADYQNGCLINMIFGYPVEFRVPSLLEIQSAINRIGDKFIFF